jgi:putative SOS response-associated peptidase YedK
MKAGRPFALAGLWEHWRDDDGEPVETCAILTTETNALVRTVHDRMPVILTLAYYGTWLDPATPAEALHVPLRPYPAEQMEAVTVGSYVSNPRNEGPECLAS